MSDPTPITSERAVPTLSRSGRSYDSDAVRSRSLGHPVVVGDHAFEVVAENEGRCDVDRIKRAQDCRIEQTGIFEDRGRRLDERHRIKNLPGLHDAVRCSTSDCSNEFGSGKVARNRSAVGFGKPSLQRRRLALGDDQLHKRRSVDVVRQRQCRSASRIAARAPDRSGPGAGAGRPATSRRALRPRPAARRACKAVAGMGVRRATRRPRSVIVTVPPAAARATTADAFCLSDRIPTSSMCFIVAHGREG